MNIMRTWIVVLVLLGERLSLSAGQSWSMEDAVGVEGLSLIPYVQLAHGVIPGGGLAVRWKKDSVGLQLDGSTATIMGMAGADAISIAALVYPFPKQRGLNMGIGIGRGRMYGDNGGNSAMIVPFSFGYQGESRFFSCELHPLDDYFRNSWELWLPSVKYGWCF